ncbi:TonB-dependent siderophore receptor [Ottowia sp.]|uniref:TonB-dependent siderophore receptor n=1 Tax=Ottowia sp. TaxID=1898956 RepID=UPI0039E5A618
MSTAPSPNFVDWPARHGTPRHTTGASGRIRPRPSALAVALQGALASGLLIGAAAAPQQARAQDSGANSAAATALPQGDAVKNFDIPAGPLDAALDRFARAAGVNLAYDQALVAGRSTRGVSGSLSVTSGLLKLLEGSGLEPLAQPGGGYSLRRSARAAAPAAVPTSDAATLAEVKVTAQAIQDGTTEGSGSYKASYTSTATKLALSPRETPQTISVITRQQMDDFSMTSVDDALKATSGVFVWEKGLLGATYYSRGFKMQTQFDGISNPAGINDQYSAPIDSAFLDRIEVLQGASGLLTGPGNPGGTINLIRKQPTEVFQAQTELQIGSWNQKRLVGDISGPIVESGKIRGRLVAVVDNSDSFTNYVFKKSNGAYGVITADISPLTKISGSIQHWHEKTNNSIGVPFASDGSSLGLSRDSFFGDPREVYVKEHTLYTASLDQKLPNEWGFNASYNHGKHPTKAIGYNWLFGSVDKNTGDGLSIYGGSDYEKRTSYDALDAYITGPLAAFGRKHELVFGASFSNYKVPYGGIGYSDGTPINVYTFDPLSLPVFHPSWTYSGNDRTRQVGAYAVGRFELADNLKVIVGSRFSWYDTSTLYIYQDASGPQPSTSSQKENGVASPYAGVIYTFSSQASIYASYSDIFNPQSNKNLNGSYLEPVVGSNYEIGIKGSVLDRKLNYSIALFRLMQTNLASIDNSATPEQMIICGGDCYRAADKVQSQGLDIGLNGEISTGWNLAAGYTYVSSKYAAGDQKGQPYMTTLPQHSLRIATNYRIPQTKWSVGGDIRAFSKIYNANDEQGYYISRGALTIVGLVGKYEITPKADLTLRVDNLFDKKYYATVDSLTFSPYGQPRKVSLSLLYRF